ncbi:unnamed protein product [Porites lobata]|uniref:Uncharacterized protein n=1 Tax=Porites lobata TaxID=104759 RepID=A0ABN8N7B6_9CNID|nr:unnamed protein product [Porites lobata]
MFFILGIHRGLENRKLKEFYIAINCSINHATNFHSRNNATVYVIQDNSADYCNHVIVFTTKYHRCTYSNYVSAYVIIYTTNYHRNNINCHNSSASSTAESITSSAAPTTTIETTTVATTASTSSESTTSSSTLSSTTETPTTTAAKTASSTILMTFSTPSGSDSSPSFTGKKNPESNEKFFSRNQEVILSASLVGFCLIVIVGVMLYLFKRRVLLRQKTLNIRLPGMMYDRVNIV